MNGSHNPFMSRHKPPTPVWDRALEAAARRCGAEDAETWLRQRLGQNFRDDGKPKYTKSTITNWKTQRDIAAHAIKDVAEIVGRSREWLETGVEVADRRQAAEPPAPPPGFADRRGDISDSDWALLQDIKTAMLAPTYRQQIKEILSNVSGLRRVLEELRARQSREHLGDLTAFEFLSDEPGETPVTSKPASKGRK
jgi:hypothetical protein